VILSALGLLLGSLTSPNSVVVFPDRAVVTRRAAITCGSSQPVRFEGVPLTALESSFRASVSVGSVDGLHAQKVTSTEALADPKHPHKLQLTELSEERRRLDDELALAREQAALARNFDEISIKMLSRELSLDRPDLKAWQLALDAALSKLMLLATSTADLEIKERELQRRDAEVREQYSTLARTAWKPSYVVEVSITCTDGAPVTVDLSYTVASASWSALYEARAGQSSIELSTYATVSQASGESWDDVELELSTAAAAQDVTPPATKALMVFAHEEPVHQKVLIRRDEAVEHAQTGANDGVQPTNGLASSNEGLSVRFKAAERAKVPADLSSVRVFVGKARLKATYELRALPKRSPVAFRVAQLVNQLPWPLLAGPVDVFRGSGLVGRYSVERVAQGAPFTLTLGIEDSVRVKRTVIDEVRKATSLFRGGATRLEYAYRFELANYGTAPVEVLVSDHLPVSELDDLTVKIAEKTTAGYALQAADGIATWKVSLKSQERKNVDFAFQVEVPSSYQTGSL